MGRPRAGVAASLRQNQRGLAIPGNAGQRIAGAIYALLYNICTLLYIYVYIDIDR